MKIVARAPACRIHLFCERFGRGRAAAESAQARIDAELCALPLRPAVCAD
jgi:hypothetical protein